MTIQITPEFKEALDSLHAGENVLITGKAGTGKSTLLRLYLDNARDKRVLVTAPTGVAALNVGGFTIHKSFGFVPSTTIDDIQPAGNWHLSDRAREILKTLDVLVVDEISMVRSDLFDMMDRALRLLRGTTEPFGGVQLVLVGDLLQLPPVVTEHERWMFKSRWEGPYFFSADVYRRLNLKEVTLGTIWRQADPEFIEVLNQVREGSVDEKAQAALNSLVDPDFEAPEGWVTLTSRRSTVQKINAAYLTQLSTKKFVSHAELTGDADERSFPGVLELHYAVGSRVMTVINDPMSRFVNGSFGTITEASEDEIVVRIDESHEEVKLERHIWGVSRPTLDGGSIVGESVGTVKQFPVILAWAITIHKSQGKTIPKLLIDLRGGTTTDGQFYVALSRAVDMDNLRFTAEVESRHIRANNALVRKLRREVANQVTTSRVVFLAFDGVDFGISEHIARVHTVIYDDGVKVADFGSWINPSADLGDFGEKHKVPAGGLAMAPRLGDFWPLLLRQAAGGIVVGDRLAMLERAFRHQERSLEVRLGAGYEAYDFDIQFSSDDVAERCRELARAYEQGRIKPQRGRVVPESSSHAQGAAFVPSWAPKQQLNLDAARATDQDQAWVEFSNAFEQATRPELVERSAATAAEWAIERGGWTEELRTDFSSRLDVLGGSSDVLPAVESRELSLPDLLVEGTRVTFTGTRKLLGESRTEEELEQLCESRNLEYRKYISLTLCDVVIAGDVSSMSNKAKRAREYGKPIISIEEFDHWFRNGPFFKKPAEKPKEAPTIESLVDKTDAAKPHRHAAAASTTTAQQRVNAPSVQPEQQSAPIVPQPADEVLTEGVGVAFRGSTYIHGALYPQGDPLSRLCEWLGLEFRNSVTKTRCDVVVTDDLESTDGKMMLAREYQKPCVTSEDFTEWAERQLAIEDQQQEVADAPEPEPELGHNPEPEQPAGEAVKPELAGTAASPENTEVSQPVEPEHQGDVDGEELLREAAKLRGFSHSEDIQPTWAEKPSAWAAAPAPEIPDSTPPAVTKPKAVDTPVKWAPRLKKTSVVLGLLTVAFIVAAVLEVPVGLGAILLLVWMGFAVAVIVTGIGAIIEKIRRK